VSEARQVRVTYRRFVSDGNYGTEGAEVSLEFWVEPEGADMGDDVEAADDLLNTARNLVLNRLRSSNNANVRMAVTPRTTTPPSTAATVPSDDEERLPF
jgi:hypothetical protein